MTGRVVSTSRFPLGRLAALLTIVGMTAMNFVSCGGIIQFKGHEIIRNVGPSADSLGGMAGMGGVSDPGANPFSSGTVQEERKTLFSGQDRWVHFVYLGGLLLAVIALLLRSGTPAQIGVGFLGLCCIAAFIFGFNALLNRKASEDNEPGTPHMKVSLDLEIGAYLAIAGFVGVLADGLRKSR